MFIFVILARDEALWLAACATGFGSAFQDCGPFLASSSARLRRSGVAHSRHNRGALPLSRGAARALLARAGWPLRRRDNRAPLWHKPATSEYERKPRLYRSGIPL